jgi:hypothetical protein
MNQVKDMYLNSRQDIPLWLNAHNLVGEAAEIGVRLGGYSAHILSLWNGKVLFSIDPWKYQEGYSDGSNVSQEKHDKAYEIAKVALNPFGERSQIIKQFGKDAAKQFDNESLDFVYIDAQHSFDSVVEDIETWMPKVKKGGVLAGHDFIDGLYGKTRFQVQTAVLSKIPMDSLIVTSDWPPTWIYMK